MERTQNNNTIPRRKEVYTFVDHFCSYLFPLLSEKDKPGSEASIEEIQRQLENILQTIVQSVDAASDMTQKFLTKSEEIKPMLNDDAQEIYQGDPAASSIEEVMVCYPGFYAILLHRMAHILLQMNIKVLPRMIAEYAHFKTGIDIHPGAQIGAHFCIDHGSGIVIGESAVIGKHVKIYQGVTLGALSVSKDKAGKKRHPTIGNHVVIYSRASILGGKTHIGDHSIIGGNVWLTHSVDANSVVLNKSETILKNEEQNYLDYII